MTLVELIVAFTILAMLASMSVPLARYKVRRNQERELRYALMRVHYRTQLNFTWDGMNEARESLGRIDDWLGRVRGIASAENAQRSTSNAQRSIQTQAVGARMGDLISSSSCAWEGLFGRRRDF